MRETVDELTGEIQIVVFDLSSEHYGVDISDVREIMRMQKITRVPGAYSFVEGVINLRGKVLPVIDLRKRLGLNVTEHTKESRIVVIDITACEIGVIVDAVSEVLRIPRSSIEPAASVINHANSSYLRGIAKLPDKLILLIDSNKALSESNGESIDYQATVDAAKSNAQQPAGNSSDKSKQKQKVAVA